MLRVVVAEDEALYRDLLSTALSHTPDIEVAGTFASGESLLAAAPELNPHAAVLDLEMGPGLDGLRTALQLRQRWRALGIVLLTHHAAPRLLTAIPPEHLRGWAYLMKGSVANIASLRQAITDTALGRLHIDPSLVARRAYHMTGRIGSLTTRQRDIVELLAMGWDNDRIAAHLSLAPKTIENHLSRIYEALELHDFHPRVRTVLIYLEETYSVPA